MILGGRVVLGIVSGAENEVKNVRWRLVRVRTICAGLGRRIPAAIVCGRAEINANSAVGADGGFGRGRRRGVVKFNARGVVIALPRLRMCPRE